MPPPATLKALLDSRRSAAREAFLASGDGIASAVALTAAMDAVLGSVLDDFPPEARRDIAVLALGGYGRGELFPYSDVDVMILTRSGDLQGAPAETASTYLHALWDVGLNVGHSVRTVDEALAQHGAAIDAWIAMLESRCVCGNRELAEALYRAMGEKLAGPAVSWRIAMVLEESAARQARFGSSVKLLEPNIKKSAGG